NKENFDLVFMDVQMPEMDGLEATAAIREKEQGSGRRQPIVALAAHAMKGDSNRCLAAGMDGYLSKTHSAAGAGLGSRAIFYAKSLTADRDAGRKGSCVTAKTQMGVGAWRTRCPRCLRW